jgi:hypothetical protein
MIDRVISLCGRAAREVVGIIGTVILIFAFKVATAFALIAAFWIFTRLIGDDS